VTDRHKNGQVDKIKVAHTTLSNGQ